MQRTSLHRLPLPGAIAVALLALSACGGGGDGGLTNEVAQGYAADSTTMTVSAASGLDSAASALETGLTGSPAAQLMQAQSAQPDAGPVTGASGTANCAAGGTVSWSISGGTAASQVNGQLDAGEVYAVTYASCATGDGTLVLDGGLTLTVNTKTSTSSNLTLATATGGLTGTTALGSFTYQGSVTRARTVVTNPDGSWQSTGLLSSSGLTLTTTRPASYTLNSLSWTVVKNFDAAGALTSRTHQGTLNLAASTPRRPNATLQITTQGALTIGSDGLANAGSFSVVTSRNRIVGTYGNGTITLQLDLGDDGTIDRTWVLTRSVYNSAAG